ncbi:hypothetical protein DFH07DRAFT_755417 [Mycena maculata]|uniref:CxC2-like cysteine cluster KDZ transposase-associated domain-containing protein n=1 Tax=Mycena maculata TaxID=230809 RepID=A0AAD7MV76_9AGAR|nr:hypothetical protein DFH07DRAFT_755417 [Mycena maculata]
MRGFVSNFQGFLSLLFAGEFEPDIGKLCGCGLDRCTVRCTDCFQAQPTCVRCFVSNHTNNPFHWVEEWNGSYFVRKDLTELGYAITLGHHGDCCPQVDYDSSESYIDFHLIDGNGIHHSKFVFCNCAAAGDRVQQLMQSRIFPASAARPTTGFTFNFMESSHLDVLESKKSAYDFIAALRRKTNNAFPQTVPDVYKLFLRVMRVWRALVMEKCSGQCHGIDKHFPRRTPGGTVVPCFACPEPGFNMEEEDLDDDELRAVICLHLRHRHINTLFLSADGHFGLQRKSKIDDPDDVSLTEGKSCFPTDSTYQEYVENSKNSTEKSTCARLNAANFQNKLKFRGCAVSGVVGITCARHSTFKRDGIVDLHVGERYANTDYALCGALHNLPLVRNIVLTYDIACQYSIKLVERFRNAANEGVFPSFISSAIERLQLLVPKMHLQGHKDDCRYRWSLNWTKWMGRTDGERIEGTWAEAKQAGGMTKEMNAGHRHDTLNDFFNDWNWIKVQNLATSLSRLYTKAKETAEERREHFQGLSILRGHGLVHKWQKEPTQPYQKGSEWHSVYRLKEQKAPSQAKILKEMIAGEQRAEEASQARATTPVALFLNVGLKLQAKQYVLRLLLFTEQRLITEWIRRALRSTKIPTSEDDQTLDTMLEQQRLGADLKKWHQQQRHICPQVVPYVISEPYKPPQWEKLFLPSDFTSSERIKLGLETLGAEELKLRQGEANDALRSLREHIQHSQALRQHKNARSNAVHGQEKNTRAVQKIKDVQTKIQSYVNKYRQARTAMIALGCNPQDPKFGFPELRDEDLYTKNVDQPHNLGDGGKVEGWIWRQGYHGNLSEAEQAEYVLDSAQVQWHRARADMERWQEEVEILAQEFRRAIQGFNKMGTVWTALAHDHEEEPGKKAYALKVASMYQEMGKDAQEKFAKVGGTWPRAGVSLAQHIKSERPDQKIDWDASIAEGN